MAGESLLAALLSKTIYNERGELKDQVDPAGLITRSVFDDAGRLKTRTRNPGGSSAEEVQQTYAPDGQLKTLKAINATTNDQETIYTYGVTLDNSEIANSLLLRKVECPDNGEVFYEYNRQGERIEMTDQNGTVHSYSYDKLGRQTIDAVGLASGSVVDDAVLRSRAHLDCRNRLIFVGESRSSIHHGRDDA